MDKNKLIFKEYTKAGAKSSVWRHFLRTENGTHAQCIKCKKIIKCQSTTTCLHNHLKLHNKATETPTTSQESPGQPSEDSKKRKVIDMYFQATEDKMEDMIAKMTACDGLPFSLFCTSESIQKLFKKSGYQNIPKSPNTIKRIVISKSNELKSDMKKELKDLKSKGLKFSVSLDEWTSARNRRYMNVNLHSPQFQNKCFRNLGLIRITSRGTAEHCINILEQKLKQYDIDIDKDIACGVTDGASVMCSMGRKMPSYHQQCLAHGIQCAVVDVIYKKNDTGEIQEMADDSSETERDTDDEEGGFVIHRQSREITTTLMYYKDLVAKVRKVVKLFKKSPTKYEVLEKYTENEKKNLILDCKTRWSSMADMISRFLLIKDHIMKALIDVKSDISFTNAELHLLDDFSTSLNIVKTTVEAICQEQANLLTCEAALEFMVNKLENLNTFISRRLLEALKERIAQRRKPELVCTLKYLHNPKKYYDEALSSVFTYPGNDTIIKTIIDINEKYFKNHSTDFDEEDEVPLTQIRYRQLDETMDTEKSLKEQLQKKITDTVASVSVPSTSSVNLSDKEELETSVRMQMALFDVGGPRNVHLEQAYNFLLCIPPTSVECERVFSSSKYLCNHLRCSLKDDSLDALSFLRSHYQRQLYKK